MLFLNFHSVSKNNNNNNKVKKIEQRLLSTVPWQFLLIVVWIFDQSNMSLMFLKNMMTKFAQLEVVTQVMDCFDFSLKYRE